MTEEGGRPGRETTSGGAGPDHGVEEEEEQEEQEEQEAAECNGPDEGDAVPDLAVAVVDARTPGNVGTVARSMKNFGLSDLLLVDPPPLSTDGEAYGMAGHAREDVLPGATEVSFDDLVRDYHTVACTAITNEDGSSHVRYPATTPGDLPARFRGLDGPVAIVFGRERVGLTNDELARMDELCSIPASDTYPVLNLGQAATVVCYELRNLAVDETQHPDELHETASPWRVEGLHEEFADFLDAINHPSEKRHKARRLFRRVMGRADLTGREATTLRGLLRRARTRIDVAAGKSEGPAAEDRTFDGPVDAAGRADSAESGAPDGRLDGE